MNHQVQKWGPWLAISTFFALLCAVRSSEFFWIDGDSPWHLLTGKIIRQTLSIPVVNIWDVSAPPFPWMNISWLYDLCVGIVYSLAGMSGIVVWVLCASTTLLVALVVLQRLRGVALSLAVLGALCAHVFLSASMTARPQLAAQIFFIGYLLLLSSRWPDALRILSQALLAIFWVNTHGSYLLLVLMVLAGIYVSPNNKSLLRRILIECLPLVGILLNPFGTDIFAAALASIVSDFGPILEWLPPELYLQVIIILLTVFGLVTGSRRDSVACERFLLIPLAYLAISSARHVPFFAIVATVIVTHWFQSNLALLAISQRISRPILSGSAAGLFLVYHLFASQTGLPGLFSVENIHGNPQRIPLSEVAHLRESFSAQPIFAFYNYGGLVLFLTDGEFHPFVDGRAVTAFSNQRLSQYMSIQRNPELINKTNLKLALIPIGELSNSFTKLDQWSKRFCGPVACLFEKL
jgi:hypothetical protein